MSTTRPKVIVRIRPCLTDVETSDDAQGFNWEPPDTISYKDELNEERTMRFDHVLTPLNTSDEVTAEVVPQALTAVFEGLSCTILMYGQSGAGKTYTMENCIRKPFLDGLLKLRSRSDVTNFSSKLSVYQIHLSKIQDLLNNAQDCELKWVSGGHDVVGNNWVSFENTSQALDLIAKSDKHRVTANTKLNSHSSRSHCIVSLQLEWTQGGFTRRSRVSLVDLAGSERVKDSQVQGQALQEAININQGLSHLSKVLRALIKPNKGLVPFRGDVLSEVLQTSMTSSWMTLVLCMSPAAVYQKEGVRTLRFGNDMLQLKVRPRRDLHAKDAKQLELIIEEMRQEMDALQEKNELLEKNLAKRDQQDHSLIAGLALKDIQPEGELENNGEDDEEEKEILTQQREALVAELETAVLDRETMLKLTAQKEEFERKFQQIEQDQLSRSSKEETRIKVIEEEIAKLRTQMVTGKTAVNSQDDKESTNELRITMTLLQQQLAMQTEFLKAMQQQQTTNNYNYHLSELPRSASGHVTENEILTALRSREEKLQRLIADAIRQNRDDEINQLRSELRDIRTQVQDAEKRSQRMTDLMLSLQEDREIYRKDPKFQSTCADAVASMEVQETSFININNVVEEQILSSHKMFERLPVEMQPEFSKRLRVLERQVKAVRKEVSNVFRQSAQESREKFEVQDWEGYNKITEKVIVELQPSLERIRAIAALAQVFHDLVNEIISKRTTNPLTSANLQDYIQKIVDLLPIEGEALTLTTKPSGSPQRLKKKFEDDRRKSAMEQLLQNLPASCDQIRIQLSTDNSLVEELLLLDGMQRLLHRMSNHLEVYEIMKTTSLVLSLSDKAREMATVILSSTGENVVKVVTDLLTSDAEARVLLGFQFIENCCTGTNANTKKIWIGTIGTMISILDASRNQAIMQYAMDALTVFAKDCLETRTVLGTHSSLVELISRILRTTATDTPRVLISAGNLAAQLVSADNTDVAAVEKHLFPQLVENSTCTGAAAPIVASSIVSMITCGRKDYSKMISSALSETKSLEVTLLHATAKSLLDSSVGSIALKIPPSFEVYGCSHRGEFTSHSSGGFLKSYNFLDNQQFLLRVPEKCCIAFAVNDPHFDLRSRMHTLGTSKEIFLGIAIFAHNEALFKLGRPSLNMTSELTYTEVSTTRDQQLKIPGLSEGVYVVVVYNSKKLMAPFNVSVCSNKPIEFMPADMGEIHCTAYRCKIPRWNSKANPYISPQFSCFQVCSKSDSSSALNLAMSIVPTESEDWVAKAKVYGKSTMAVQDMIASSEKAMEKCGTLKVQRFIPSKRNANVPNHLDGYKTITMPTGLLHTPSALTQCWILPTWDGEDSEACDTTNTECTARFYHYGTESVVPYEGFRQRIEFMLTKCCKTKQRKLLSLAEVRSPFLLCGTAKSPKHLVMLGKKRIQSWYVVDNGAMMMYHVSDEDLQEAKQEVSDVDFDLNVEHTCDEEENDFKLTIYHNQDNLTPKNLSADDCCVVMSSNRSEQCFAAIPYDPYDAASFERETSELLLRALKMGDLEIEKGEVVLLNDGTMFLVEDVKNMKGTPLLVIQKKGNLVDVDLPSSQCVFTAEFDDVSGSIVLKRKNK